MSLLADAHCHLEAYPEAELPGIVSRAGVAGVGLLLGAGLDLDSSRRSAEVASRFPPVLAGIGLHPAFLPQEIDDRLLGSFRELAGQPRVGAISEIGLDSQAPHPSLQREAFLAMLRLSQETGLPIVLHSIGAHQEVFSILKRQGIAPWKAVMHYFQGDSALAHQCLERGIFISVGRPLLREPRLQAVIREVPLEGLLLETDAYPHPGRTTEPAQIKLIAEKLAEIKGVSLEEVARHTTANLQRLLHPKQVRDSPPLLV